MAGRTTHSLLDLTRLSNVHSDYARLRSLLRNFKEAGLVQFRAANCGELGTHQ